MAEEHTSLTEIQKAALDFLQIDFSWQADKRVVETVVEYVYNSKNVSLEVEQCVRQQILELKRLKLIEGGWYYVAIMKARETAESKFRVHKEYIESLKSCRFAVQQ